MNGWKPVIFLEEAEIEYDLTQHRFFEKGKIRMVFTIESKW